MQSRNLVIPGAIVLAVFALASFSILATAAVFTEPFTGAPAQPAKMTGLSNFEVIHGTMWNGVAEGPLNVGTAQHGPSCEAPGEGGTVRHVVPTYADLVFQCRDHVMTHLAGDASLTYLTPNQLLDLSGGTGTVKWDVSTTSLSTRDWIGVWIQNWDTQEQRILDTSIPAHQGNPRNAIQVEMGAIGPGFESGSGMWHIEVYDQNRNLSALVNDGPWGRKVFDVTKMSAQARTTFQVDITPGHIKLWLPAFNHVLAEGDIPALGWNKGVVTFGHFAYSADKGANPFTGACCEVGQGEPNTWHWDNLSVSPSIPFTIVKPDHRSTRTGDVFQFSAPAPANAIMRFEAWSRNDGVRVSFDDGPLVKPTMTGLHTFQEQPVNYIVQVPPGVTRARIVADGTGSCCAEANNPHIFALSAPLPPTPSPTATSTAVPTATPTKTPTPAATGTPVGSVTPAPTGTVPPTVLPTGTSTPVATPPTTSATECQAQFRYRDTTGTGVFREVWRSVDCATGEPLEPIR